MTVLLRRIAPAVATPGGRGQRRAPRPGWRPTPTGKRSAAAGRSEGTHPEGRTFSSREGEAARRQRTLGGKDGAGSAGRACGARGGEAACGGDQGARPSSSGGWWCPTTARARLAEGRGVSRAPCGCSYASISAEWGWR